MVQLVSGFAHHLDVSFDMRFHVSFEKGVFTANLGLPLFADVGVQPDHHA